MNADFSERKKYLLILDYYENGKTDVEWYENFDDAKKRAIDERTNLSVMIERLLKEYLELTEDK